MQYMLIAQIKAIKAEIQVTKSAIFSILCIIAVMHDLLGIPLLMYVYTK